MYLFIISFGSYIIGKSNMATPLSNKNLCHSGTDRMKTMYIV
jgi:hypothetical protein